MNLATTAVLYCFCLPCATKKILVGQQASWLWLLVVARAREMPLPRWFFLGYLPPIYSWTLSCRSDSDMFIYLLFRLTWLARPDRPPITRFPTRLPSPCVCIPNPSMPPCPSSLSITTGDPHADDEWCRRPKLQMNSLAATAWLESSLMTVTSAAVSGEKEISKAVVP